MKITEVRIFPAESRDGKLKAFATMTFDDWFVVRNVKIIQGTSGLFVAMPSRKVMDTCPKCSFKNARGSKYCNQCGKELPKKTAVPEDDSDEKQSGHMDIAHPVTPECRIYIQKEILETYEKELSAGRLQGENKAKETPRKQEIKKTAKPAEKKAEEKPVEKEEPRPNISFVSDREKDIEL
ncbi:MAG TPA: SpoVG family protein [Candidatus Omnitrophota bacterium]|nr:SpoVG family protein [Candidatus Omnitrophota bacterium]